MKTSPTTSGSRRALFARLRGGPEQIRPPWSRDEADFLEACEPCGMCIAACPTGVLVKGHAGYPIVDFGNAACTLCGKCADVCKQECFIPRDRVPWSLKASIGKLCVEPKGVVCRACQENCPSDAITFKPLLGGGANPIVSFEKCTGCGACMRPCPVRAISITSHPIQEHAT